VFTDAVAFSTRVQQNEESALHAMQADFDVMREVAGQHDGRVLKTMGDGFLIVFDSAAQAVDAALEIQRRFEGRPEGSLQHRMGVHLCDVVLEENDAHGDGVNLAARLEAEASPGGICLSQTIYDIVKSRLPVQAKFLGERHLKNLVEPVNVFEIAPSNAPRGQRIPPKGGPRPRGNYATAGALVFLGLCILAFAAVQVGRTPTDLPTVILNSPRGPRQAEAPPTSAKPSRSDEPQNRIESPSRVARREAPISIAAPKETAEPPDAEPPAPKPAASSGSEHKTPKVGEGVVVVTTVPLSKDPQYCIVAQRFAHSYDFKGMRTWLEEQEAYRNNSEYEIELAKWSKLEALMTRLETDLESRDQDTPLRVSLPLARGAARTYVWSSGDGKVEVRAPNGHTRKFEFRSLDPMAIRALAMASAREKGDLKDLKPLLATFDQEFRTRYGEIFRKMVRPGNGAPPLPPIRDRVETETQAAGVKKGEPDRAAPEGTGGAAGES